MCIRDRRIGDILLSLIALIILSPLLLLTALLIKIEDRGPVFFRQKRCTKNGKVFEILKFRSMIVDAEKGGETIPCRTGDPRITHVGRVIRKLRIDEFCLLYTSCTIPARLCRAARPSACAVRMQMAISTRKWQRKKVPPSSSQRSPWKRPCRSF